MVSMHDDDLLPLFPLAVVLLPHNPLPLHIFEDRYKKMIGALEASGEFGVVMAAGQGLMPDGCTATVEEVVKKYPDGRMDIVTLGRRRFTIAEVDAEYDYLRARVTYFDDEDSVAPAALRERAVLVCRPLRRGAEGEDEEIDADDPQLSFQLAAVVADLDFQNMILRSRSESERLQQFIAVTEPYLEKKQYRAKMQKVAGQNGSGHKPAGI